MDHANHLATAITRNHSSGPRAAVRYVVSTAAWMAALYALVYQPWPPTSLPGQWLGNYLQAIAACSAVVLQALGESVSRSAAVVGGRFSYSVVVDCAALDVQALFVGAVLSFPVSWRSRWVGLSCGLLAIFAINILRLVVLYYAGAESLELFRVLHEEVFVLLLVGLVCGLFVIWARWAVASTANAHGSLPRVATGLTP